MPGYKSSKDLTKEQLEKALDSNLHWNFKPHAGQVEILEAVLNIPYGRGMRRAFVRCGRKFGKSTLATYICYKLALYFPKAHLYLLAPMYKQAKEIYWASGLVPEFLHIDGQQSPFVTGVDNQETRISLYNGSFIKVDGSDNYASQRGWNPFGVVGDEFAEFDPRWLATMTPNLASKNALLLLIGTPPEFPTLADGSEHQYVKLDRRFQREHREGKAFWIHRPSTTNTALFAKPEMVQWLKDEKERLEDDGLGFIYQREYEAKIVQGGQYAIFPQYDPQRHMTAHASLVALIAQDPERYEYYCGADPGTRSIFAVLFIVYDKYTSTPYFLDEMYQKGSYNCTVDVVMPLLLSKVNEIYPHPEKWNFFSDSAAAWFIEEANSRYDIGFSPTIKRVGDKEDGIGLIRDILRTKERFISERCFALGTEIINYATDDKGRIPKTSDHCLDIFRYFLKQAGVVLIDEKEPESPLFTAPSRPGRSYTTSDPDSEFGISELLLTPYAEYIF